PSSPSSNTSANAAERPRRHPPGGGGPPSGGHGERARQGLAAAADAAAATGVSGPALVLTLDDAPREDAREPRPDEGRVYDQDLQILVNGLWAAGATAIGVNGRRLTPTTAIRTAGEAILVDYRPLSAPYEITALAAGRDARARLRAAFEGSEAGRRARLLHDRYGIRYGVRAPDRAELPGGGALRPRYAREGERP
ncbi:DUF881 domain-containing protein, partial [Spirillospora sp. NPDC029432]|uniref:DUF881 domain-containing protein n=1 Tax=Spirillospora sp. NPDC029432 TaxID=3154599 RepID=UPI0034564E7F